VAAWQRLAELCTVLHDFVQESDRNFASSAGETLAAGQSNKLTELGYGRLAFEPASMHANFAVFRFRVRP